MTANTLGGPTKGRVTQAGSRRLPEGLPETVAPGRRSGARLAVGLMSGTSMDGIDAALVRLAGPPDELRVRLLAFVTVPYPSRLRQQLLDLAGGKPTTAEAISHLNFLLGDLFAEAALEACRRAAISPKRLSAVGSHGQTIFHQGFHQGRDAAHHRSSRLRSGVAAERASTLQIADPAVIAERTGAPRAA